MQKIILKFIINLQSSRNSFKDFNVLSGNAQLMNPTRDFKPFSDDDDDFKPAR